MKILIFTFLTLRLWLYVAASSGDYYWKEYIGVIPPDALPGGKDLDGYDTYIGQAYIHQHGQYVVQIFPGKKEVEVPCYGVKKTSVNIKILCTPYPNNFEWVSTDNKRYHLDMTEKIAVQGGYDFRNNNGMLHIGRLLYQGVLKVGEIASYNLADPKLFFPHNNVERSVTLYQALVYRGFPVHDVTIIKVPPNQTNH